MAGSNYVNDYETLSNLFLACFLDYKEDVWKEFVIHESQNDLPQLLDFLDSNIRNGEWHISFNGIGFDAQITEFILVNRQYLLSLDGDGAAKRIYEKAQDIISKQTFGEWQEFPEWKLSIKQLDLYKMLHYDNANRRSSLKWIQYSMDWHNVQEMPIPHGILIKTKAEIEMIKSYCRNDVLSTRNLMRLAKDQINMRSGIFKKYGLPCHSYSNTKIGSELLLNLYCKKTGRRKSEVKWTRTKRDKIILKDIIFDYVKFQSQEFNDFLLRLRGTTLVNTKGEFKYSVNFKGCKFDYGTGGMHQCTTPGVYEATDDLIIRDLDVASLYPSLAVVNGMFPAHLGKEFSDVYKHDIVDVRLAEKAKGDKGDKAIIEGFKEAANASYGNSNSQYSWLYDPQYTVQTTMNGQLLISMLVESIILAIPSAQLLQTNTDGATFKFPKSELGKYNAVCEEWEKITGLKLEFADYQKMFIWDVNNYFSIGVTGKVKCKGRFEWEDLEKHKVTHLHKNKSHLIVPKAIFNYFVNNIPPEKYLSENRNIMDYCAGVKSKGDWRFFQTCVVNGKVQEEELQKVVRYYISHTGCKIIKKNKSDGRTIQVESGQWLQTEFNLLKERPWVEYGVNDEYYLEKIYQEIANISPVKSNQLSLFE